MSDSATEYLLALREALHVRQMELSLREFVRGAWDTLWPGRQFLASWHIDAICEHLQAVSDGDIRRLIINIPPRHAKSTLASVMWPCWEWTTKPETQWLYASYAASLTVRDSLYCRRLIQSPWYRERWGNIFKLADDENRKTRFDNDRGGYRLSTSVGGSVTGEGGDRIVVDDPHKAVDIWSDHKREQSIRWWREAMSTRTNDPRTAAKVIIMQRLHVHDLSGYLMDGEDGEQYVHLVLPARWDGERRSTIIGWQEPRQEVGEFLWPERFGPEEDAELRKEMGSESASAQLDQIPAVAGGSVIRTVWIQQYDALPDGIEEWLQSWDLAFKGKSTSSYVVGQVWARRGSEYYLVDQERGQWDVVQTIEAIRRLSLKYPKVLKKIVEDKANGPAVLRILRESVPGLVARSPDTDKLSRLHGVAPLFEAGNVRVPYAADWLDDWMQEVTRAPQVKHWDQIDSMTQALLEFTTPPAFYAPGMEDIL